MTTDINALVPAMRPKVQKVITEAAKIGYKLRIVETYRTAERQAELYAQGRSRPGRVITNAKPGESMHEKRRAVDLVDIKKGYNIKWDIVGQIAQAQGLVWGGTFGDNPHLEYHGPESEDNVTQEQKDFEKAYVLYEYMFNRHPENHEVVKEKLARYQLFRSQGIDEPQAWHELYKEAKNSPEYMG